MTIQWMSLWVFTLLSFVTSWICAVLYSRAFTRLCKERDSIVRENQDLTAANERLTEKNDRLAERRRLERQQAHDEFVASHIYGQRDIHVGRPLCTETDPNAPLSPQQEDAA